MKQLLLLVGGTGLAFGLGGLLSVSAGQPHSPPVTATTQGPAPAESELPPVAEREYDIGPFEPLDPDTVNAGYSGSYEIRLEVAQEEEPEPEKKPVGWKSPPHLPRWNQPAANAQLEDVADALSVAVAYEDTLERMYQLAGRPTPVQVPDGNGNPTHSHYATRFLRQPERMAELLLGALRKSKGVARQNLIFQAAIALPERVAFPVLRELASADNPADAEDALCALAFRGEPTAIDQFEVLARAGSPDDCNILCERYEHHDDMAKAGRRDVLRSYRCIEMLDLRPYFRRYSLVYNSDPNRLRPFPWADELANRTESARAELARRILPAWLRRYPGHSGSDDMAYRLCMMAQQDGDFLQAARCASRCATFPDQDMNHAGTREMLKLAEMHLTDRELLLLNAAPDHERNRNLVHYVRIRRIAARDGVAFALQELEQLAATDPGLPVVRAWQQRWAAPALKGLDSGVSALPADDPLRRVEGKLETSEKFNNSNFYWSTWRGDDSDRTRPQQEAVRMNIAELASQFRAWETLLELEHRRDASFGQARADFVYKIAAIMYHQPRTFFPGYGSYRWYGSGVPREATSDPEWAHAAFGMYRAAKLFEKLADENRDYAARDKALFSAAMAHIKIAETHSHRVDGDHIENAIRLFERCAAEHPDSSLADDSLNAARYRKSLHFGIREN